MLNANLIPCGYLCSWNLVDIFFSAGLLAQLDRYWVMLNWKLLLEASHGPCICLFSSSPSPPPPFPSFAWLFLMPLSGCCWCPYGCCFAAGFSLGMLAAVTLEGLAGHHLLHACHLDHRLILELFISHFCCLLSDLLYLHCLLLVCFSCSFL